MIADLRGTVVLLCALLFFMLFIGLCLLGAAVRPGRWSEGSKTAT